MGGRCVWNHGLTTRLKKKNIFHPSSQAPGPGPGPAPGPRPGPLRRRMENLNKRVKNSKKCGEAALAADLITVPALPKDEFFEYLAASAAKYRKKGPR